AMTIRNLGGEATVGDGQLQWNKLWAWSVHKVTKPCGDARGRVDVGTKGGGEDT
ncbi:hypothetical protein U1Q18_017739, partial [Sarracenia purpurea var. burkii]